MASPAALLTAIIFSIASTLPLSKAQSTTIPDGSCPVGAQPIATLIDPPSGTPGSAVGLSTNFTITGDALDQVDRIRVYSGTVMNDLGDASFVGNSSAIQFQVPQIFLASATNATISLISMDPDCLTTNLTVTLYPTMFFNFGSALVAQPGTVLFILSSGSCVPGTCGDSSTTFDVIVGEIMLERLNTPAGLEYAGRFPSFEERNMNARIQIMTQFQVFTLQVFLQFQLFPAQPITSVMPSTGQRGTNVTITIGDALANNANVEFSRILLGSSDADIVSSRDARSTSISVRARSGLSGTGDILINTTDVFNGVLFDGPYTHLENGWTQIMDGNISDIIPQAAQVGRTILMCGDGLLGGGTNISTIEFGSIPLTLVQSSPLLSEPSYPGSECIEAQLSSAVLGNGKNIISITSDTGSIVESTSNFTVSAIESVVPNRGQINTVVTIRGDGLLSGYDSPPAVVFLSNVRARVLESSNTEIVLRVGVPSIPMNGVQGNIDIHVTNPFNSTLEFLVSSTNAWQYEESGIIATVTPDFGQFGTVIDINGTNLLAYGNALTHATIGNVNATILDGATDTLVQLVVPENSVTGNVDVILFSDTGTSVRGPNTFQYRERGVITSTSPDQGQDGTYVTILGTNLSGHGSNITSIRFGEVPATIDYSTFNNDSSIEVRVQGNNNSNPMNVSITIISSSSAIVTSLEPIWTFLVEGQIALNEPQVGQAGTRIEISGTNLLGGGNTISEIFLDGVSGSVVNISTTRIVIVMDDVQTQRNNFFPREIYIMSDTGAIVSGGTYVHRSAGVITSFSPTRGRRGTVITIAGMDLLGFGTNITDVIIAGVTSTVVSYDNNAITVQAGTGETDRTGPLQIVIDTGALIESTANFTFDEPGVVNEITPTEGAEGTGLLVRGSGLLPSNVQLSSITIGGIPVSRVVTQSNRELSVIVGPAPAFNSENATILITASDGSFVEVQSFSFISYIISLPNISRGLDGTLVDIILPSEPQFEPTLTLRVTIDDQQADIVSVDAPLRMIEVRVPRARRHGTFMADVTIEGMNGIIARLRDGFRYLPEGIICITSPMQGQFNTAITLQGEYMLGGGSSLMSAEVAGQPADVLLSGNEVVILRLMPEDTASISYPLQGDITLTANTGGVVRRLNAFTLVMPGNITELNPDVGQNGTRVNITGNNLLEGNLTVNSVTLAGIAATIMGSPTNNLIVVEAAPSSTLSQPLPVVIELSSGATISSDNGTTFQYLAPGRINTVQPNSGTVGTIVIISGIGLLQGGVMAEHVLLGGIPAMINSASNMRISVTARTGLPISGGDVVIVSDTGSTLVGDGLWSYEALGRITNISPPLGQQGTVVTISGISLLASSATRFSRCILAGIEAEIIRGAFTSSMVQCRAGFNPGERMNLSNVVELTTDTGVMITSSQNDSFTYYTSFIQSITPSRGNNGTVVIIQGTNLFSDPNGGDQVSAVLLGDVPARVTNATSNVIYAIANLSLVNTTRDVVRIESTSGTFLELTNAWNYTEPGQISFIDPKFGLPGDNITLYGENLVPDGVTNPRIILGQTEAFGVYVINSSTIQFRAAIYKNSDNPEEDLPIQVISPTGETVFNSTVTFQYNTTESTVNSISPAAGSEGSLVVISGTNLPNISSILDVSLAGVSATVLSSERDRIVVRALAPPLSGVRGQIIIETTTQGLFGLTGNAWEYYPVITARDVSPTAGRNGTIVTLDLSRISDLPTVNQVYLANVSALILGVNNSILTVLAGPSDDATPSSDIRLELSGNISITIFLAWEYQTPVIVNDIAPRRGYFNTRVTINGSAFPAISDSPEVYLAGIPTVIQSQTTNQIIVTLTANTVDGEVTGPIIIMANGGEFYSSENLTFTYMDVQITSVNPPLGTRGTLVTLTGVNLLAGGTDITSLTVGGIPATTIQNPIIDTSISFTAGPSPIASDIRNITYFLDTGARVDIPLSWMYTDPGTISSVSPTAGAMGTIVSISGENLFSGGSRAISVILNSQTTTDILQNFDNFIQVIASEGDATLQQPGSIQIISDTQAITESTTLVQFTYLQAGTIGTFSPTSGQNGTNITITGERLHASEGVARVFLAGVEAQIISIEDRGTRTSITVLAGRPTNLGTFDGPIVIRSLRNTTTISAQNFTYQTEGIIFSVTPNRGRNGTIISIDGENILGGGSMLESVVLAGIEAAIINQTSSRVTVRSPMNSNTLTGNIVLMSDTNAHVTRIDGWTYIQQGVIDSISPQSGQYGTRVNITGQDLLSGGQSLSVLQFGDIPLDSITTATDNSVSARVTEPNNGDEFTTQSITLISEYGGVLYLPFSWNFSNQSNISSITPPNGVGGTTVIVNGTNLLGGGNRIELATVAGIMAVVISSSDDEVVIITGSNVAGDILTGELVLESDTGALTVGMWSYDEECMNNTFGTAGNCMPCNEECNGCNGPTEFNCTECENFNIVMDDFGWRCVSMCPNVSSSDGRNVCMDTCELNQYAQVDTVSNVTFCYNCSDLCDPDLGCSGPEPSQCQGCRFFEDTVNQTCIARCSNDTHYISEIKYCRPCHPQCSGGCLGPSDSECSNCANMIVDISTISMGLVNGSFSNRVCRDECPPLFFLDATNNYCRPCDSSCSEGCSGPTAFDCTNCISVSIVYPDRRRMCVPSCNNSLRFQDESNVCQPCNTLCFPATGCTGPDSSDCIECNLRQDGECVSECTPNNAYFIENATRTCVMCHSSCGDVGCTGAGPGDCSRQGSLSAGPGTVAFVIIVILLLVIVIVILIIFIVYKFRPSAREKYSVNDNIPTSFSNNIELGENDTAFSSSDNSRYIKTANVQSIPLASIEEDKTAVNPLYNKEGGMELYSEMGPEDGDAISDVLYTVAEPDDENPLPEKNIPMSASQDLYTEMGDLSSSLPIVEEFSASQDVYTDMESAPLTLPPKPTPLPPPSGEPVPERPPVPVLPPKSEIKETKKAPAPPPSVPEKNEEADKPLIPDKPEKPPPPGPPSETAEGPTELYVDMQEAITEVFINNNATTQDDLYEDVHGDQPNSSVPTIDDTYEDTETMAAAVEDYRKSFVAGTKRTGQPIISGEPDKKSLRQSRQSAPALPSQPIPKRYSSTTLPPTPLQKSLSGTSFSSMTSPTSPTSIGRPESVISEASIPEEESLYDDIPGMQPFVEPRQPPSAKQSKPQPQKRVGKLWSKKK